MKITNNAFILNTKAIFSSLQSLFLLIKFRFGSKDEYLFQHFIANELALI